MGVVSHGYGELGGGRDGSGGWYACGEKPGVVVDCQVMPEHILSAR